MLDECKGERLEEVLAVFSNVVLKKVLQEDGTEFDAIAKQLAFENLSYTGERTVLSSLIAAHKASLSNHLREKNNARARYQDFEDLLNLNNRRIARRHEQLKEAIEESQSRDSISNREAGEVQDCVRKTWSGNDDWLDTVLYGDNRPNEDGLLTTRFDKVWKHVENGSIGEVEGKSHAGLLEQLDARVRDQEKRLARWQDFGRTLNKGKSACPSKDNATGLAERKCIELGFNGHEALRIGRYNGDQSVTTKAPALEEYSRLVENIKLELANVGKPQTRQSRAPRRSLTSDRRRPAVIMPPPATEEDSMPDQEEEWSSVSDTEEPSRGFTSYATKSTSQTPPSEAPLADTNATKSAEDIIFKKPALPTKAIAHREEVTDIVEDVVPSQNERSPSPPSLDRTPPPFEPPNRTPPVDSEAELADQILESMSATSPSPKKPRHTLSLAERTRLSMSRSSHSQYSDLHDEFEIADLPRPSIKPRQSIAPKTPSEDRESQKHADLIERTRKSMAGFEATQKKAQLERRRSVKDQKRKQRESSYFPRVEEEVVPLEIRAADMMEGDPDYESVFKSRPRIKTSPAVSPTRNLPEDGNE